MATRRAEQKARTRARILEAARAGFEADGFEATTIASVAARADVAVGTVMAHFRDKRALVAACFHDSIEAVIDEAMATVPEAPVIARLLHVSEALYRFYARNPPLSRALVREATFPEGPVEAQLGAQLERFLAWVGAELGAAAGRGELREGVDLDLAPMAYWADYFLVLLMVLHDPEPLDRHRLTLEGLLRLRFDPPRRVD